MEELFYKLRNEYKVSICDEDMFTQALTHSSYGENLIMQNYEKLEFLGDAIIKSHLSEWLFKNYPEENQGFYTKARIQMEKNDHLILAGRKLELVDYIKHGKSLDIKNSESIIADIFEAVVGCVHLQNDYLITKNFVLSCCLKGFNPDRINSYKTMINEYIQKTYKSDISIYNCTEVDGEFICIAQLDEHTAVGTGKRKKISEENAAKELYKLLFG